MSLDRVRHAQLVIVLDILAEVPDSPTPTPPIEPLVFTVPPAAERFIEPLQRLDLLVDDAIARANSTLHIGGPFWNAGGWDRLKRVVLPALADRHVAATFYLHPSESGHLDLLHSMLAEARAHGAVHALWWAGGVPSLMHAKFVVSDRLGGYFGSANLTSLGLGAHLEMGVALAASQAGELLHLLDSLERAGLFTADPAPT